MYSGINDSFRLFESDSEETFRLMVVLSDDIAHDSELKSSVITNVSKEYKA